MSKKQEEPCVNIAVTDSIRNWLDYFNFPNAIFSNHFISQLAWHHLNRVYNVFAIFDEIKFVEGKNSVSRTKPAKQFDHEPLNIFWHKHHYQASFIPTNIINFWNLRSKNSKTFDTLWEDDVFTRTKATEINTEVINLLSHELVYGAFEKRFASSKMTGEWIIFAKCEGKNYYLTLARHTKTKEEDIALYRHMVATCRNQFPFLFSDDSLKAMPATADSRKFEVEATIICDIIK